MSSKSSYRKEQLPFYIEKLKSMIDRNFEIMTKPVEGNVTEDKFYNILKARRMGAEQSIWGAKKVDSCYKELDNLQEDELSSYYREVLPDLISHLKEMFELNLEVIDLEVSEKDLEVSEEVILRVKSVADDKLHNVIKSRKIAAEDSEWALRKIEELETELNTKEDSFVKQSHAKRLANLKRQIQTR